jgi:hypothetical protein
LDQPGNLGNDGRAAAARDEQRADFLQGAAFRIPIRFSPRRDSPGRARFLNRHDERYAYLSFAQ